MSKGGWDYLGHSIGECWVHNVRPMAYVNIPKNASTFIKSCLGAIAPHYSWILHKQLVACDLYLIALREPIKRWISGMSQFKINNPSIELTDTIFDQITFDDHTDKQVNFLKDIDLNKCVFFKVDETLRGTISKWVKEQDFLIGDTIDKMPAYNVSTDIMSEYSAQIIKLIENNPQNMLKLKQYFADDYALYNSVKFYD